MKKLLNKIKVFCGWVFSQLKDWKTFVLFLMVFLVMSFEVWGFYLIGIITGEGWWIAAASACWLFWLGPFTPFFPLCIAITLAIKKLIEKFKNRKGKK
jgi:hypothetical protein